jgi:hypothetical protein
MPVRVVDDKPSDTLVVVSGEGFWTGSSTLPHLHQSSDLPAWKGRQVLARARSRGALDQPPDVGSQEPEIVAQLVTAGRDLVDRRAGLPIARF